MKLIVIFIISLTYCPSTEQSADKRLLHAEDGMGINKVLNENLNAEMLH